MDYFYLLQKETKNCLIQLCNYLHERRVGKVIVLTSVYAHIRTDEEITDNSEFGEFRYVASPLFSPPELERMRYCITYYVCLNLNQVVRDVSGKLYYSRLHFDVDNISFE